MKASWRKATWIQNRSLPGDLAIVAFLAIAFLLLRLPFRSEFLVNWDAVQLALGTEAFNLHHHQPHPPGYIGYVAVGWLLNHFTGDANESLTLISAISGAAAPALFYLLALEVFRKRTVALAGAILLGTSPLAWYYSGVALTYMPECALALGFGLAAYRARTRGSWHALVVAAVLLAVIGSFRQTGMVFLLPVFVWALVPFTWPRRFGSLAICGLATVVWVVPLLWLAGGLQAYLHESAALAELAGGPTSIVSGSPQGIGRNVVLVTAGLIFGLNAALALPFVAHRRGLPKDSAARQLVLLWTAPAMLVYLLGHTGQVGYVLFVLPPAVLGLLLAADIAADAARSLVPAGQWRMPATLGAVAAINVATFTWGPDTALRLAQAEPEMMRTPVAAVEQSPPKPGVSSLTRQLLQFSIPHNDAYWRELIEYIEEFDPDEVVILTSPGGPRMAGSFRHLAYYLPQYRVLGMTRDREGDFGQVFSSYRGENDYSIDQLADAKSVILLDNRVDRLIIPDPEIARELSDEFEWEQKTLESGATVTVVEVPRSSTVLVLRNDEDEEQLLAVRYPTLAVWKHVVLNP